jgi:hypothetical protein
MNADELKALQAPLKQKYKDDLASAVVTLRAESRSTDGLQTLKQPPAVSVG